MFTGAGRLRPLSASQLRFCRRSLSYPTRHILNPLYSFHDHRRLLGRESTNPRPLVLNDLNRLRVAVAAASWIDEGLRGSVIAAPVPSAGAGGGIVAWAIG
jgi:hypothetical protein